MTSKLTEEDIYSLIGLVKDKLTVIGYDGFYKKGNNSRNRHYYLCQCSCGKTTIVERRVITDDKQLTASCGCNLPRRHGLSKHPAYNSYKSMMGRVRNPHPYYHRKYIENHIGICDEWNGKPENFLKWADENGFKRGLSLDRIDNLKGYYPENCRWVDSFVQANNRGSYNHNITYNGKTQSITMWARELGMAESTLRSRLDNGMSIEDAFILPVKHQFNPHKTDNVKKKLF